MLTRAMDLVTTRILLNFDAAPPVTLATRRLPNSVLRSSSCLINSSFFLVRSSEHLTRGCKLKVWTFLKNLRKMLETFLWRNPSRFGVRHTHCFHLICPSFAHLAFIELKASRLNKWGSEMIFVKCQFEFRS